MPSTTNFVFKPGKLTFLLDGGAGSSGKGRIGSYVTANADNFTFACNAFHAQAGHWVVLEDGRTFFYQTFNSCAYQEHHERLLLGPGAIIELPAFFREIEESRIPRRKIGISPIVGILQGIDAGYERGECDFSGNPVRHHGTMKHGSTCHGCGAASARRILRRSDVKLARDVPELQEFLCDTPREIMMRLDHGEAGFCEIAQGFQLSLYHQFFYPACTSRPVTVAQAMSDLFIAPRYAGPVILNFRSFPIRINSRKFVAQNGRHLTWADVQAGEPHTVVEGDSGHWYPDQRELTWEDVTKSSGSPEPIMEITSVTKLPRRVATFSRMNVEETIRHNRTDDDLHISINFMDYVDSDIRHSRRLTDKAKIWLAEFVASYRTLRFLGTGPKTEDTILMNV